MAVEKLLFLELYKQFVALGWPINDVLDFLGHFYPSEKSVFWKEGVFQQPRDFSPIDQQLRSLRVADDIFTEPSVFNSKAM